MAAAPHSLNLLFNKPSTKKIIMKTSLLLLPALLLLSINGSAQSNSPVGKGYNVATGKYADLADVKDFILDLMLCFCFIFYLRHNLLLS